MTLLSDWRRRIDEIDRKLVQLLNERSHCALEIGKLKQEQNLPLYQPDREREVIKNAQSAKSRPALRCRDSPPFRAHHRRSALAEREAMHPSECDSPTRRFG